MTVEISIAFDRKLFGNAAAMKVLWNSARFIRDLWLSQAPHVSGDYARGLQRPGSISVQPGKIVVRNFATAAGWYENGTKSFNWGLRTLAKGRNVKIAKDGSRYKVIRIDPKGGASFRKPSIPMAVISAFRATIPRGRSVFAGYGGAQDIARQLTRKGLLKPLKPKRPGRGAMKGFFVVSEKAIKESGGKKWFHEAVPGKFLARSIERAAQPIVDRAISQVAAAEQARKARQAPRRPLGARR